MRNKNINLGSRVEYKLVGSDEVFVGVVDKKLSDDLFLVLRPGNQCDNSEGLLTKIANIVRLKDIIDIKS